MRRGPGLEPQATSELREKPVKLEKVVMGQEHGQCGRTPGKRGALREGLRAQELRAPGGSES